ncbi:MAG: phosphoglycerate dehydrogenase [Pseudomonadota bacterium]
MKILITDKLDESAVEYLLERNFEVEQHFGAKPEELMGLASGVHGWIIRSGTRLTEELLSTATDLKVVGRAGVGVDNIDIQSATRLGIAVLNTPSGNTIAAVEHSMALLLSLARHIPQAHYSLKHQGLWERSQFTGVELCGKTIGILGLGKIGGRVAMRCQALEMKVVGFDPYLSAERAREMGITLIEDLAELLGRCDFISLHLPSTENTRGIIGAESLAQCKPGIRIVNCARGNLVDELALAHALQSGQVAGAALDVFQQEPPAERALLDSNNLIVTPHLGASTVEAQRNVGTQIAEQVADALDNGIFREAVNIPVQDWSSYSKLKPQIDLVERLGQTAQQYCGGGISAVDLDYEGESFKEVEAMNNAFLTGLLRPVVGEGVNSVNAPVLAEERGVTLRFNREDASSDYQMLVRVQVTADGRQHELAGTIFSDNEPRLVGIDGFSVELFLFGVLLIFGNSDKPGVIGNVGELLGRYDINIAHFSLGRSEVGGDALGIVAVDERISDTALSELGAIENMRWVTQIELA